MSSARFTKGDSVETTRNTGQKGQVREPRTKSVGGQGRPRGGNTMNGMPGFVRTGAGDDGEKSARGGKAIRPLGPPGKDGAKRYIGHKGGGAEIRKAERGGTGTMGNRSDSLGPGVGGGGHRGRMERLQGTTKSFTERKRSNMY